MKSFIVFCLVVACIAGAPNAARNKRNLGLYYNPYTHSAYAPPIPYASGYVPQVVSYNKLLNVNRVVNVPHVVNVPKVLSVPEVVSVNHVVHQPIYNYI